MSYSVKPGNTLGRIGEQFAAGLGGTLPKGVENYRLAEGLEGLNSRGASLSPAQQYAALVRSGASDQQINSILPILERSNANAQAMQQAEQERRITNQNNVMPVNPQQVRPMGSMAQPQGQPQGQPAPQTRTQANQPEQATPENKRLITADPEQQALNPILPLSTQERRQRGASLRSQFPSLYPTAAAAEQAAEQERNDLINQQNSVINQGKQQKALRGELEAETNKRLGENLQEDQKQKIFDKVPGEYYKKVIDKQDEQVASGKKTSEQAAKDAAKEIREFADLRLANETQGLKYWLSKSPKETRSLMNRQREGYAKAGELKTFVNDMVTNHGLSEARASYLAYPIDKNKELNNYLASQKKIPAYLTHGANYNEEKAVDIAKNVGKYLKADDSLLAIAAEVQGKNYDSNSFLDAVNKLYNDEKIALTPRQREELDRPHSMDLSRGDWFLFEIGKLGALPEVQ